MRESKVWVLPKHWMSTPELFFILGLACPDWPQHIAVLLWLTFQEVIRGLGEVAWARQQGAASVSEGHRRRALAQRVQLSTSWGNAAAPCWAVPWREEGSKAAVKDLVWHQIQHNFNCITWIDGRSKGMTKLLSEANIFQLDLISYFSLEWPCDKGPVKPSGDAVSCSDYGVQKVLQYLWIT